MGTLFIQMMPEVAKYFLLLKVQLLRMRSSREPGAESLPLPPCLLIYFALRAAWWASLHPPKQQLCSGDTLPKTGKVAPVSERKQRDSVIFVCFLLQQLCKTPAGRTWLAARPQHQFLRRADVLNGEYKPTPMGMPSLLQRYLRYISRTLTGRQA